MTERQESLEYIIIMIDEMRAEAKKLLHNLNYGKYNDKAPDMEYLKDVATDIFDHMENAEHIFADAIPPETQKVTYLKDENIALKDAVRALQDKLNFALEIKKE